tara:strand:- start:102 stop:311 length:210 start_codon:yes stop_codon:yes gene_type:complete
MVDIISRFKEPSSYSAIAAVMAMVGVIIPSDLWQSIVMIGCGVAGAFGFFMKERDWIMKEEKGKIIKKS